MKDRPSGLPEVAGKNYLDSLDANFQDRRPENVTRIAKHAAHRGMRLNLFVVLDREQAPQALARVFLAVKRRAVSPLRLGFLEVAAVRQHHAQQVARRLRRIYRALESHCGKP